MLWVSCKISQLAGQISSCGPNWRDSYQEGVGKQVALIHLKMPQVSTDGYISE